MMLPMSSPSSSQDEPRTDAFPIPEDTSAYPSRGPVGGAQGQAPDAAPGQPGIAPSAALVPFDPTAAHEPPTQAQGAPYGAPYSGGAGLPPQGAAAHPPFQGHAYPGAEGSTPGAPYSAPYGAEYASPTAGAYGAPVYNLPKSKVAALLLALFLGCLGIHNFYLGHTGKGVAQLLISVLSCGWGTLITGPWALIEGILVVTAQPGSWPWGVDAQGVPLN